MTQPDVERFWSKVNKRSPNECWMWAGAKTQGGYGVIEVDGKTARAHRIAYMLHTSQMIPEGMMICHHCDSPPCCNPAHLFIGTHSDNMRDCVSKGRNSKVGERNGRAKMTERDVCQIRLSPLSLRVLAKHYSVHHSTINAIKRRRSWGHYEEPICPAEKSGQQMVVAGIVWDATGQGRLIA